MHLLTSNFNLLHTNTNWLDLKKKNFHIDSEFNNFFFILNDQEKLQKFKSVHAVLDLNKENLNLLLKKINLILNNINLKNVFIYILVNATEKHSDELEKKFLVNLNNNVNIKIFKNIDQFKINTRNKKIISFPYDVSGIKEISKIILDRLKIFTIKPYKLIILDCDNTLWGGILDENIYDKIIYAKSDKGQIFEKFQIFLKSLKDKGFILSICSKNNTKNVWKLMKYKNMVLQKKDFLLPKINWNEKSFNIKEILSSLNLREEDAIFIDDNYVEIQKVKNSLKKINCLHFQQETILSKINKDLRFEKTKILKEDRLKYKQYSLKNKYENLKKKYNFKKNNDNFFKSLKQKIKFIDCNLKNFDRALQLISKTNQFNFSLCRYSADELKKIIKNKAKYVVQLVDFKDKFGSHGIVGLLIIEKSKEKICITDFLLSCRILYRKVEDYIIYHVLKLYKNKKIEIHYNNSTLNNKLIPIFLKKSFFKFYKRIKKKEIYLVIKNRKINEAKKFFRI